MNSKPLEGIHPTVKCAPQCPFRTSDVGHLTRDEFGAHGWRAVFEPKKVDATGSKDDFDRFA